MLKRGVTAVCMKGAVRRSGADLSDGGHAPTSHLRSGVRDSKGEQPTIATPSPPRSAAMSSSECLSGSS